MRATTPVGPRSALLLGCVLGGATFAGCQDYNLKTQDSNVAGAGDTGTITTADTSTGDSAPADTDTGTVIVSDSGDSSHDSVPNDTGVVATESVYLNTSDTLYSYDPSSNTATRIGGFKSGGSALSGITDIAIDLGGHMFGVSFSKLYNIDPTNANCTFVANISDQMTGLTFVSDGRLVGAGTKVSFVDTTNGNLTTLVPSGRYTTSGDIIGLPDGMLYWTVQGGDDLVQVDPNTGATAKMGSIGVSSIYGLGYADGKMLGFTSGGKEMTIDSGTGRTSDPQSLSGSWWGATTNPVLW